MTFTLHTCYLLCLGGGRCNKRLTYTCVLLWWKETVPFWCLLVAQ